MAPAHQSLRDRLRSLKIWCRDHARLNRKSTNNPGSEPGNLTASGAIESDPERSEVFNHLETSTVKENQPADSNSGKTAPEIRTCTSMDTEQKHSSANSPQAAASKAPSTINGDEEELIREEVTTAAEEALEAPPLHLPIHLNTLLGDNETPIWLSSITRFKNDHPSEYELMVNELHAIQQLKAVDSWDTWLNSRNLDEDSKDVTRRWLRKCKAYMPSVALIRSLAMSLSNLDPHKIAPPVTAGIFILIELCFGLVDPTVREKAMEILLKTNIVISKWSSRESDLGRMKIAIEPSESLKCVNPNVKRIEDGLGKLYLESLLLISKIYKDGKSRAGRSKTTLPSGTQKWDQDCFEIQRKDSEYEQLRSEAESALKKRKESIATLDWISDRNEDPEPAHQIIKERTGIDDAKSDGGKWFLDTPEFSSWMHAVSNNGSPKRVFWVKGSMGTGKTTLLCRTQTHYEQSPTSGIRLLPYYCYDSGSGPGPSYERVLRALCRRLAWTNSGRVAREAESLYDSSNLDPEAPLTMKKVWEPLLKSLVSSSSTRILFLIDALDECQKYRDWTMLLEFLTTLQDSSNGMIYFIISSRPHIQVEKYFEESVQAFEVIQPETKLEMKCFIDLQISAKRERIHCKDSIFFTDHSLLEQMKLLLLNTAGGMFRWVEIWLNVFFPEDNQAIRLRSRAQELMETLKDMKTLDDVPHDQNDGPNDEGAKKAIKEAYKRLWEINCDGNQYKKLQFRLFQILTAAFENLNPQSLLDAVRFDPDDPDRYTELGSDQLKSMYSGFLQVNSNGYLEYEHLSAKIFVQEIEGLAQTSHRIMADIGIKLLQRPSHTIWEDAGIYLMKRKEVSLNQGNFRADTFLPLSHIRKSMRVEHLDRFGTYLYQFWLQHCQICCDEPQFAERMSELFRAREPGLESWIAIEAARRLQVSGQILERTGFTSVFGGHDFKDTLTRLTGELRPDPFLCMVSFGFSPFSQETRPGRVLLSGFEDATLRELRNSDGMSALHIACDLGNTKLAQEVLEWNPALLTAEDLRGRIPLHYVKRDEIVDILLDYETSSEWLDKLAKAACGLRESKLLHWKDKSGMTPMMTNILCEGNRNCLRRIIEEYFVESLDLLLFRTAKLGWREIVEQLVKRGANPNAEFGRMTALSIAVHHRDFRMVALLEDYAIVKIDTLDQLLRLKMEAFASTRIRPKIRRDQLDFSRDQLDFTTDQIEVPRYEFDVTKDESYLASYRDMAVLRAVACTPSDSVVDSHRRGTMHHEYPGLRQP